MIEVWKDIIGYKNKYQISNFGNVKSLITNKILKPGFDSKYLYVSLCDKGKCKLFRIHRLLAIHFIPNPYKKLQVNHKDGNKINNNLTNLEWCTNSENRAHAALIGLMKHGEDHHSSKLTEKQVKEIRKKFNPRIYTIQKLANKYNVSNATIQDIIYRRCWKHI